MAADPGDRPADATAMDAVTLQVRDLPGMSGYDRTLTETP